MQRTLVQLNKSPVPDTAEVPAFRNYSVDNGSLDTCKRLFIPPIISKLRSVNVYSIKSSKSAATEENRRPLSSAARHGASMTIV